MLIVVVIQTLIQQISFLPNRLIREGFVRHTEKLIAEDATSVTPLCGNLVDCRVPRLFFRRSPCSDNDKRRRCVE
jgi:hypothetical protein